MNLFEFAHLVEETRPRNDEHGSKAKERHHVPPLELKSDTYVDAMQSGQIAKIGRFIYDAVAVYGPTYFDWRTGEGGVIPELTTNGITSYNLDMGADWNADRDPKAEAEAMSSCAVLAVRIEASKNETDGGLGSLVEIPKTLSNAYINGQRVVICIDANFKRSLESPAARAQYEGIMVWLKHSKNILGDKLTLIEKGSRADYVNAVKDAVQLQRNPETQAQPLSSENLHAFAEARRQRMLSEKPEEIMIIDGGSSAPFSDDIELTRQFYQEKSLAHQVWEINDRQVTSLYEGYFRLAWDKVKRLEKDAKNIEAEDPDKAQNLRKKANHQRKLAFQGEMTPKIEADVINWMIQNEAISLSAITEEGFIFLNGLASGQQMAFLHEPFDYQLYIQTKLVPEIYAIQAEIDQADDEAERQKAQALLEMIKDPEQRKMIKKGQFKNFRQVHAFKDLDNTIRPRAVSDEQMAKQYERLKEIIGQEGIEVFIYSTDVADFIQKCGLASNPEAFKGREEFFHNFIVFKEKLRELVNDHLGERDQAVELIREAMEVVNPFEAQFKGLHAHLADVQRSSQESADILLNFPNQQGETYLSPAQFDLISNYAAPLHDFLKFLDANMENVQVLPDHEILIGLVINEFFGELGFNVQEIKFLVQIVSDHENIFKEKGRSGFSRSENPIERGKAFFFVQDTLTGAIVMENNVLTISEANLKSRFENLYFRHMDKVEIKKKKLPEPRPQWGLETVKDWISYFRTLEEVYNVPVDPNLYNRLIQSALNAIELTLSEDSKRVQEGFGEQLTNHDLQNISNVKADLETMMGDFIPRAA